MALPSDWPYGGSWTPNATYVVAYRGPESWVEIAIPSDAEIGTSLDSPLTRLEYIKAVVYGLRNQGYQVWASKTEWSQVTGTTTEITP